MGAPKAFVDHYTDFLGSTSIVDDHVDAESLFMKKICSDKAANMIRPVKKEEIKKAIFNIGDEKAPGPNGYTFAFFK